MQVLSAYTLATQKIDPIMLLELSPKRLREAGRGGKKYASVAGRETKDEREGERERERELKGKGQVAEEQKLPVSEQLQSQPLPKPSGSIFTA